MNNFMLIPLYLIIILCQLEPTTENGNITNNNTSTKTEDKIDKNESLIPMEIIPTPNITKTNETRTNSTKELYNILESELGSHKRSEDHHIYIHQTSRTAFSAFLHFSLIIIGLSISVLLGTIVWSWLNEIRQHIRWSMQREPLINEVHQTRNRRRNQNSDWTVTKL
ncbi:hypothetical protein BLOT_011874 [Blomia tropicalis]|nr:hypothetical protein BLOT_011874 [Blomia tropicalis]